VRKAIRGHATKFMDERGVQPAPKLGVGAEVLTGILTKENRRGSNAARPIAARPGHW
jgi:hypothetical protein